MKLLSYCPRCDDYTITFWGEGTELSESPDGFRDFTCACGQKWRVTTKYKQLNDPDAEGER